MATKTDVDAAGIAAAPVGLAGGTGSIDHLIAIEELTTAELVGLIDLAGSVKADPAAYRGALDGLSVTMLFEKPSLRTRMTFEIGLTKLGAHVVYFDHSKQRIGERESVKDYIKNLERWTDVVIARVFDHGVLEGFCTHGRVAVINALSDREHPCQALADLLTIRETIGFLEGARLCWVGDGNNVCHSLMLAAAKLGMHFTAITPKGFEPSYAVVKRATESAAALKTGATITLSNNLEKVRGHHAVYTDTWVSMGEEHQGNLRDGAFANFTVDDETMAKASAGMAEGGVGGAIFMHCLPAHRGEEVTDEVIDSAASVVYDQAENRMHAQNALVLRMMGKA
ncbi:MAG: ornithine carbamoyltransferase [Planctomycetota bacterium]